MRFKSPFWFPIAVLLSVGNLIAVGFAVRPGEPWWHATGHAMLAVAFGLWAERRRRGVKRGPLPPAEVLEALEGEVSQLRRELGDAQERLDFAERMMAQRIEQRREPAEP